jgi:hypothetical protein
VTEMVGNYTRIQTIIFTEKFSGYNLYLIYLIRGFDPHIIWMY